MGLITGRGAWSIGGRGGTVSYKRTGYGPYYALSVDPVPRVGAFTANDLDHRAVHYGVMAIQRGLNRERGDLFLPLVVDGLFGIDTASASLKWQKSLPPSANVTPWGGFGPDSVKALLIPKLKAVSGPTLYPICYGIIQSESGWDVGAVGVTDPTDRGLAQINQAANPNITEQQCFSPSTAFAYIAERTQHAIDVFGGDVRTAIASYNLGLSGANLWRDAGSPALWTPAGSTVERDVNRYIDKILSASL